MTKAVITGMGVLSTGGYNLTKFWDTLLNKSITYKEIDAYKNDKNYRYTVGARILDTNWHKKIWEKFDQNLGLAANYSVYTALQAIKNADIEIKDKNIRTAICIGTTMGEIQIEEKISEIRAADYSNSISKSLLENYKTENIGFAIQNSLKTTGKVYNVPAACAAGNYAVALGTILIQSGLADVVITGGVDVFSRVAFAGFQRLLSLAPDICKPFDLNRKGLIVGEGCGIVILENPEFAKKRGAKVLAYILGTGLATDSYHMTSPHPDGKGAISAMEHAIREADINISDIDYISAHGTGTRTNDKVEVKALKKVFGENKVPPASSIKSMLGHSMGAASALELIASAMMIENNILLPTVNFSNPDPECDIDCVPNEPRKVNNLKCILSNSFAFGGQTSSIIISKNE